MKLPKDHPSIAECIQILSDTERTPTHTAPHVRKTIMQLVAAYTQAFLHAFNCNIENDPLPLCISRAKGNTRRTTFAVKCLGDATATAALIQDLGFAPVPLNEDHSFHSVDFGSGTGVLSLGPAIAGLRCKARRIILNLVEIEEPLLNASIETIMLVQNGVEAIRHFDDITKPKVYTEIDFDHVRCVVSETISTGIPSVSIINNQVRWDTDDRSIPEIDPFPKVINRLIENVPNFPELARTGSVRMFPNIFNGDYLPGKWDCLRLSTSNSHKQHSSLARVGNDYVYFEGQCSDARWDK